MGDVIDDGRSRFPRECSASASEYAPQCDCQECRAWRHRALARAYAEAYREVEERHRNRPAGNPTGDTLR